ncbi:hypothetical protein PR048_002766 [Dryococelus australis]|uniref:DDE Tnp4 domain-containing protein n=1 Tax=Dryococelus australis TaxID=614101 RepID=A0ABQ9IL37_9NEOP|nr:hypothetical protein PR048_002766 [Dryococelus australis]
MPPVLSKQQTVRIALAATLPIPRKKRKIWAKKWLMERKKYNHMMLLQELDSEDFRNYLRMDHASFSTLLNLLLSEIIPETCKDIYKLLRNYIQVRKNMTHAVCRLVVDVLVVFVFHIPATGKEWLETSHQFESMWQFTNCVGCMDGKHVLVNKPPGSGSLFYNYKGTFSVVLFAVVNANYEFMYVHSGVHGSVADSGGLKHTNFYENLMSGNLNLPLPSLLPGTDILAPYVFLVDEAFAISEHVLKPFPQKNLTHGKRIFNYRLSRAKRVVESVFGVLSSRFHLFQKPILLDIDNVDNVVLACCVLCNYLRRNSRGYITNSCVDNEDIENGSCREGNWWRGNAWINLDRNNVTPQSQIGNNVRNILTDYLYGTGSVPFQKRMINVLGSMH